jgi:hypothetical protein
MPRGRAASSPSSTERAARAATTPAVSVVARVVVLAWAAGVYLVYWLGYLAPR